MVKEDVSAKWMVMHNNILQRWIFWNETRQDPLLLHQTWILFAYPILRTEPTVIGIPLVTRTPDGCVFVTSLINSPPNWILDQQNCTHRWLEAWDNTTKTAIARIREHPVASGELSGLIPPVSLTTPGRPFTWGPIRTPQSGVGDYLEANVALFGANGTFMGRASLAVSTSYLVKFLQNVLAEQQQATGGRLVVYEPDGMVVAATHGNPDLGRRYNLTETVDPDLRVAWQHVLATHASLCPTLQEGVTGSVRYLLDVGSVQSDQESVLGVRWCILLLSPRVNMFGRLDHAWTFGIIFVQFLQG